MWHWQVWAIYPDGSRCLHAAPADAESAEHFAQPLRDRGLAVEIVETGDGQAMSRENGEGLWHAECPHPAVAADQQRMAHASEDLRSRSVHLPRVPDSELWRVAAKAGRGETLDGWDVELLLRAVWRRTAEMVSRRQAAMSTATFAADAWAVLWTRDHEAAAAVAAARGNTVYDHAGDDRWPGNIMWDWLHERAAEVLELPAGEVAHSADRDLARARADLQAVLDRYGAPDLDRLNRAEGLTRDDWLSACYHAAEVRVFERALAHRPQEGDQQ